LLPIRKWEAHKRRATEARKHKREAAKAARIEKAAADLAEDPARLAETEAQLVRARTEIRNLKAKVRGLSMTANRRVQLVMPKQLHRNILALIHPDTEPYDEKKRRRMEKCFH